MFFFIYNHNRNHVMHLLVAKAYFNFLEGTLIEMLKYFA